MSELEQRFTSTGAKFWRHPDAMAAYRNRDPHSIISTHISPTSACNLACSFCSVARRSRGNTIPLATIAGYVETLRRYGLKAVILTGGGEPLLYPEINELIELLTFEHGLQLGLITNGTVCDRVTASNWAAFAWVRVSLNRESLFKINLPTYYLDPDCVVGCSAVYAGDQATPQFIEDCRIMASALEARYVRVLPDCLQYDEELGAAHVTIAEALAECGDERFFHQHKRHGIPHADVCHQSYFRPYLSEECFVGNGDPGTVYPCDSVVLNERAERFEERFQLCHARDVAAWLERRIAPAFSPCEDCHGCVFAHTVNMLGYWQAGAVDHFAEFTEPMDHENFV